jgi:hypothetical protein
VSDETKSRIEELEERLAQNRAARSKAEEAQYAVDLEARISLEEQHGTIAAVKVSRFSPGHPTQAYLRTPTGAQYKRYKDQIHRAVDKKNIHAQQEASELLARSCWVYPASDEAKAAMLDAFPGLLTPLSMAAAALAEGKAEDEGKG